MEQVSKKEDLKNLVAMVGWAIIKQNPVPEFKAKAGIIVPNRSAINDYDFKTELAVNDYHPYTGVVVATGIDNVNIGDKVLINKVAHDNNSVHIKYAGEILKPIRIGDILGLERGVTDVK